VNAVDSENSKNKVADVRRRLQILKDMGDQNVYWTKFTTGCSSTLPTEKEADLEKIRDALLAFHRKHYRPENLVVVVAGPQQLDELESWVVPRFGPMEAKAFPVNDNEMTEIERMIATAATDAPPFAAKDPPAPFNPPFRPELQSGWPVLLTVKPVRSMRRLVLMFPLPSVRKIPDQSPTAVLSHLLGHEGPKSPFALLQNEGLITSLSAGNRFGEPTFSLFQVDISLTEKGEKRWKDVVDVILQYCRFLHLEGLAAKNGKSSELSRIWEEKIALNRIFFDETSPGSVYGLCPSLAQSIMSHGTAASMSAGYMLQEDASTFPLSDFEKFTSSLVLSNCIIERSSEAAWAEMEESSDPSKQLKTEQWYEVEYFLSDFEKKDLDCWSGADGSAPYLDASSLTLPEPNRYIPRSLELCADLPEDAKVGPRIDKEIDPPNLLVNDPILGRLWHRLDDRYALPKAHLSIGIANAESENSKVHGVWTYDPKKSAASSLLASIFNQALAQETYDAELAGLSWSLSLTSSGISLDCSGFSDRLSDLGLTVLKEFLKSSFITEAHFDGAKDRVLRSLRTFFESRRADSHAVYYRNLLLDSSSAGIEASLKATEALTLEDIFEQHKSLLANSEIYLDCLMCGNVSEKEARDFFEQSTRLLLDAREGKSLANTDMWFPGPTEKRLAPLDEVDLKFQSRNPHEENGALIITYQSPIPAFRGERLSSPESLESSASLRLLCHILKEPLFNELRTKQTLGYIVSSYYDMALSMRPAELKHLGPQCVPIDLITIAVLSRKVDPLQLKVRADEFLDKFRSILLTMPDSEINSHATALSTKLLKPIQKLETEASTNLSKIRRYASEVGSAVGDMPWSNAKVMAAQIQKLRRQDLLNAWDRTVLPAHRSRVVSMVHGSSFPLQAETTKPKPHTKIISNSVADIISMRKSLSPYDNNPSERRSSIGFPRFIQNRSVMALAAASFVGAGYIGWSLIAKTKKRSSS